jgi:hypothetical protein
MIRVAHVQDRNPRYRKPLDYGYMFELNSLEELAEYWTDVRGSQIREGFADYIKSREWDHANGGTGVQNHVCTRDGQALSVLVNAEQCREVGESKRKSLVHLYADFQDKVFLGMKEGIDTFGSVFVNENGGYFYPTEHVVVLETIELKNWVIPGDPRVRFLQWVPDGHWYAKVGNQDVVLYGEQKWDTKEEAMKAAKKWLERNPQ